MSFYPWILAIMIAFASGAWWQRSGCELRQLRANDIQVEKDAAAILGLEMNIEERSKAHETTKRVISEDQDPCLRNRVPDVISARLRRYQDN